MEDFLTKKYDTCKWCYRKMDFVTVPWLMNGERGWGPEDLLGDWLYSPDKRQWNLDKGFGHGVERSTQLIQMISKEGGSMATKALEEHWHK